MNTSTASSQFLINFWVYIFKKKNIKKLWKISWLDQKSILQQYHNTDMMRHIAQPENTFHSYIHELIFIKEKKKNRCVFTANKKLYIFKERLFLGTLKTIWHFTVKRFPLRIPGFVTTIKLDGEHDHHLQTFQSKTTGRVSSSGSKLASSPTSAALTLGHP